MLICNRDEQVEKPVCFETNLRYAGILDVQGREACGFLALWIPNKLQHEQTGKPHELML